MFIISSQYWQGMQTIFDYWYVLFSWIWGNWRWLSNDPKVMFACYWLTTKIPQVDQCHRGLGKKCFVFLRTIKWDIYWVYKILCSETLRNSHSHLSSTQGIFPPPFFTLNTLLLFNFIHLSILCSLSKSCNFIQLQTQQSDVMSKDNYRYSNLKVILLGNYSK